MIQFFLNVSASRRPNEASILKKSTPSSSATAGASGVATQAGHSTPSGSGGGANPGADVSQLSSHLSAVSIASSESSGESGGDGKGKSSSGHHPQSAKRAADESAQPKARTNVTNASGEQLASSSASSSQPTSLLDTDNPPSNLPAAPRSAPPSSATGAIPKSISFDKTVLDGSADSDKHGTGKHRGDRGFFRSFKLPKIGKAGGGAVAAVGGRAGPGSSGSNSRSASIKSDEYGKSSERLAGGDIPEDPEGPPLRRAASDETSDDILAKYRKKASASQVDSAPLPSDTGGGASRAAGELGTMGSSDEPDDRLVIDPQNVEASYAFEDAKRKLRLMLSEADLSALGNLLVSGVKKSKEENELVWFLKVQLAEATNLQDRGMVAQLHETLRCLSLFDTDGLRKLLRALKEDYRRRTPYLAYLVRCRQGLLSTISQQQRLLSRLEVDRKVCSQYLVSVCVRRFLEQRERLTQQFVAQFREITAADEKTSLVERFLAQLWKQLEEDPSWALAASEDQMSLARLTVERAVTSQIYMHAMYPNGEADLSRDMVLQGHLSRLSQTVTPTHRDLRVPRQYHYEAPWPSAQAEIRRLPAYKTARDKVACVMRCSQTIMNLLSLASGKSVPAADDFVPVMVFVLIKANPPGLLSTVQYVDSFYGSRLSGEEQYWWMQFVSAIEFIKTMD